MAKQQRVADYDEAMAILTKLARDGDVRAAIALAGHLRRQDERDPAKRRRDELAARRARRAG